MRTFGEFLKEKRTAKGLNLEDLAGLAKISKTYISLIENGKKPNPPSDAIVEDIADALGMEDEEKEEFIRLAAFEKIPESIKREIHSLESENERLRAISEITEGKEIIRVPVYEGVTGGRGGLVYSDEADYIFVPDSLKRNSDMLVAFKVRGNSMSPKIEDSSYILVKKSLQVLNGEIGVFVVNDEWYVKKFRKVGNFVILSSINPEYEDMEIDLSCETFFSTVGKVVLIQNFL